VELHEHTNDTTFDMNPDHTHFIITEEGQGHDLRDSMTMRCQIEDQFRKKYGMKKKKMRLMSIAGENEVLCSTQMNDWDGTVEYFI